MSKSKATPGPWVIGEENPIEIWGADRGLGAGRPLICTLPAPHGNYVADADARLIASAPRLLEALQLLWEEINDPSRRTDTGALVLSTPAMERASAAIQAATEGGADECS
jgi:hypothetical protein